MCSVQCLFIYCFVIDRFFCRCLLAGQSAKIQVDGLRCLEQTYTLQGLQGSQLNSLKTNLKMIQQKRSLFTVKPQVFNLVDNQMSLIFLVFILTSSLNLISCTGWRGNIFIFTFVVEVPTVFPSIMRKVISASLKLIRKLK